MENVHFDIPEPVGYILKKLGEAGYEAFVVGGCVRDAILGREANDWDITTSALPMEVKSVFRKTFDTGIKHGTVTVLLHEGQFEVTTYRIDGIYEDSRHPKEVTFTSNLEEDLRRRDFTINAMAYHPEVGLIDPYYGLSDLESGVIRAVGNPSERFNEDALRIMRAIRFSAQLGFAIDPETALAIKEFAPKLSDISHERIRDELVKLLVSPYPETFRLFYDLGITKIIFPEFDDMMTMSQNTPSHIMSVGEHTLAVIEEVPATMRLRVAALLHDTGKLTCKTTDDDGCDHFFDHHLRGSDFAKNWMRDMRFDNQTISDVCTLITYHDFLFPKDEAGVRHAMNKVGELFPDLMALMRADNKAKSEETKTGRLALIEQLEKMYEEILSRGDCTDLKHLAVTGADLISAGVKPGPGLGKILGEMLEEVLNDPSKNDKEYLIGKYIL